MKSQHWIGIIVIILFVWVFRSCSSDATIQSDLATQRYVDICFAVIEEGSAEADTAWTKSGKLSIMEEAFARAADIEPDPEVKKGAVVRMRQMLREGSEYFAAADDEWIWARDFTLGFLGGMLDASGGMGAATGTLFAAKGAEIASDDAERREFIEAVEELERYLSDE